VEAEEGAGQVIDREARNHLTGMESETMRLPTGQFCFNLDDGASGHYEEYWLDAETGKMVFRVRAD
jgi:hypothetical protein